MLQSKQIVYAMPYNFALKVSSKFYFHSFAVLQKIINHFTINTISFSFTVSGFCN